MTQFTVQTLTNSHRAPKWILKSESTVTAEYPEDILDKINLPGSPRITTYSDGTVEGTWERFEIDEYDTFRTAIIITTAPKEFATA